MTNGAAIRRKQKQAEAAAAAAKGPSLTIELNNPNLEAATRRSIDHIAALRSIGRRENTKKIYDPKLEEYREYCRSEYKHEDAPYTVTRNKVWWFMLYQAMRKPKKRGGKKVAPPPKFNQKEYNEIIAPFKQTTTSVMFVTPTKPVGFVCIDQYRKVIKVLHQKQQADGTNNIGWEFIWSADCKELIKHIKERKPAINKANYVENQCQEMAPYKIVSQYGSIEALFWGEVATATSGRSLNSRLRNRACFLLLTMSVLRCESLYKAEVSDFFSLTVPMKANDVHPMTLQIHQIPIGKTTYGSRQYGRAARHIDPKRCAVGATALYLECWEGTSMTKEQWKDNLHWFDIKFLANVNGVGCKSSAYRGKKE